MIACRSRRSTRPRSARATWQTKRAGLPLRAALAQELVDFAGTSRRSRCRATARSGRRGPCRARQSPAPSRRRRSGARWPRRSRAPSAARSRRTFRRFPPARRWSGNSVSDTSSTDAGLQRRRREDPVDLADLAGIGRGDDQLHHARVAAPGAWLPTIVRWSVDELADALVAERHQIVERLALEGRRLRRCPALR